MARIKISLEFLSKREPRPRKKRRPGGGSEPVVVEPNRPLRGEGGAAATLEFRD